MGAGSTWELRLKPGGPSDKSWTDTGAQRARARSSVLITAFDSIFVDVVGGSLKKGEGDVSRVSTHTQKQPKRKKAGTNCQKSNLQLSVSSSIC